MLRNMTAEEIRQRTGRFADLRPMSTVKDLTWVPQAVLDIVFARKIMPVVLEPTKNVFGHESPITGAGGLSVHISVCPPGQGPCLHSHNTTYETFMCLEGEFEFFVNEVGQEKIRLGRWDTFSCPPGVYRGFRNVSDKDSVLVTLITGVTDNRDDVSCPASVATEIRQHGDKVFTALAGLMKFDPAVKQ